MPIIADPVAYKPEDRLHIDLAQIKWRAVGCLQSEDADSRSRLNATVTMGGADFHLDAYEVGVLDGEQVGINGAEDAFEVLLNFDDQEDGVFETVSIEGRTYALVLTPFRAAK